MSYWAHHPFYTLGMIYLIFLMGRAVLSWFPIEPRSVMGNVNHWLYVVTEPAVAPFRRIIPPLGMIDVSYMLCVLVIWVFSEAVLARITI